MAFLAYFSLRGVLPEKRISETEIENFWIRKAVADPIYDIVIAGDSRVYRGISPLHIQKGLAGIDLNVLNFGFSSAGFSQNYLELAVSKFHPNSEVKILLLGVTPHSLTSKAFENEHLNSFLEFSAFDNFKSKYLFDFLNFFSPYHLSDLEPIEEKNYQEEFKEGGWSAAYYLKPDSTVALESYYKTFTEYQVEEKNVTSFIYTLNSILNQDITIIAFRPPSTSKMTELEDEMSKLDMDLLAQKLKEIGVIWLEFNDNAYASYDGSHLHFKSAEKLSIQIGEIIKNQIMN